MQKPDLIMVEWNFGLWAMFSGYDREQARQSYEKGYRYCERRKFTPDVTYLKVKPRRFFKNTRVMSVNVDGTLGEFK